MYGKDYYNIESESVFSTGVSEAILVNDQDLS